MDSYFGNRLSYIPEISDWDSNLDNANTRFFSLYNAPITNKIPIRNIRIHEAYELIKSKAFEHQTVRLRELKGSDEAKKFKISNFAFVTFSGRFKERSIRGLALCSRYICLDIDHIERNEINSYKQRILQNLNPALMFISPSGNGLKIVFEVEIDSGKHSEYFQAFQIFFETVIGLKIDLSGSDISRACFLPHDEEAYYNEFPDILDRAFIDSFTAGNQNLTLPANDQQCRSSAFPHSVNEVFNKLIRWIDKSDSFVNGNRNRYISKLANACNRYGISENETLTRLLNFSETGFPDKEIESIVRSVYKHTERHNIASFQKTTTIEQHLDTNEENPISRLTETTPLLPIDGFPFHIQELIKECVSIYGTPRDFWAISFLQATAIALGSTYEISDKYTNGALLWVALIGPSGTGKSEPIDFAMRPIYKAESALEENYLKEKAEFETWFELSKKEKGEQGIEPKKVPKKKQYIAVDSTPEGLISAHQENRRGIAIVRDELIGWILDFGRYARSGEVQNMLSTWSEKLFKIIRKNSDSCSIEKPFIPVFGGLQPAKLPTLAKDDRALDGFMQRFVFAFPDAFLKPDYNDETLRHDFLSHYESYIKSLLAFECQREPVRITKEALDIYKQFYNKNTSLINSISCEYKKSVYQKFEIIVLRIALILHASHHAFDKQIQLPIQPETMVAAVEMTEYFRITAQKVNQHIGEGYASTGKVDNKSIAQHLMRIGKISKTNLALALNTSRSQLDRLLNTNGT